MRVGRIALVSATAILANGLGHSEAETNIFNDLDAPTLIMARDTLQATLENQPSGRSRTWRVDGVAEGSVTPLRTYRSASGHWCRAVEEIITLADGRRQASTSVRCRSTDGVWKLPEG